LAYTRAWRVTTFLHTAVAMASLAAPDVWDHKPDPDITSEMALGAAYLGVIEDGSVHHHGGFGISASLFIVPRLLAVEIIGHALFGPDLVAFPIDLQLKLEAHASRVFSPYIAAGPTFVFESLRGNDALYPGLSTAIGLDTWLSTHFGFMVELNGNLLVSHGIRPEAGVFAGPAARF
jgi:hypothetical protein